MLSADVVINVQFYDLDPMEVVWHGNYPRFLEQARCALLDRIGYGYAEMRASGYAWPVVDMRIKYVRPIRMAETIVVTASLLEYENRLKLDYRIRRRTDGEVLTKAHSVQVAVRMSTGEMLLESPPILFEKIHVQSSNVPSSNVPPSGAQPSSAQSSDVPSRDAPRCDVPSRNAP